MKQANKVACVAAQMDADTDTGPCAHNAQWALQDAQKLGMSVEFITDSNVGESVTSFSPNEAYLMEDGSVYEVTYSGANWYESLEEAALQCGYIRRSLAE